MSFLGTASQQLTRSRAGYTAARSFSRSALLLDVEKSQLEIKLRDGLKTAMKSKDKASLTCLKSVLADITNAAKSSPNPGDPLPESGVIASLRKSMQNRSAAAEQYAPGSSSPHPENYSNLQSEVNLIQSYLPEAPSSESIATSIREVIDSLTEEVRSGKGVQGAVMKTLWEKLGKAADGVDRKEIGKLVSEALKK